MLSLLATLPTRDASRAALTPGAAYLRVAATGVVLAGLAAAVVQTTAVPDDHTLAAVLAVAVATVATLGSVWLVVTLLKRPGTQGQQAAAMAQVGSALGRVVVMAAGGLWIIAATPATPVTVGVTLAAAYPVLLIVEAAGCAALVRQHVAINPSAASAPAPGSEVTS